MLMSLGNLEVVEERCKSSAIGQKRPNSLWVHVSALEALDPLLRLYEGCASRTIGRPRKRMSSSSTSVNPRFPTCSIQILIPIPILPFIPVWRIDLRDLHVHYRDYDPSDNPPLLHQKDSMVTADYPLYEKFAKLTRQEEGWGLLDNLRLIYDYRSWQKCLEEHCAELKGHRVVWRKDADPYRVKLVRSVIRAKQVGRKNGEP
jgi:DNA phosphorothioation-associated putative methyltransferase